MAQRTGSRATPRAGWLAALVVVPAVLAGLSLLWPGPGIADDLHDRSLAALDATGLSGVTVAVSGRDVELRAVPRGSEGAALDAAAAVTGVRAVRVGAVTEAAPAPTGAAPTAPGPSTPADVSADRRREVAVEVAAIVAANPVTFDADSAALAGSPAASVQRMATLLLAAPDVSVELDGYVADTPGSPETAQALSERRATAVADALVAAGVDRSRITTQGRGATRPLGTLAASRRVEISVS